MNWSDARPWRTGRQQALFRAINERMRVLNERLDEESTAHTRAAMRQCANSECVVQIPMTLGQYADVGTSPVRFAVSPGDAHVFLDAETVVLQTERFLGGREIR